MELLRYERVEDTLMWFGNGISLQFVTSFAWKLNGERRFYYSEFEYAGTAKYPESETNPLVSVKRDMTHCFLCINNKNNGIGIIIRQGSLPGLESALSTVSKWFTVDYNKCFKKDGNHLRITAGQYTWVSIGKGMALKFEPTVIEKNDEDIEAARMYLNDTKVFVDLTAETINEFLVIIQKIDYYKSAAIAMAAFEMQQAERDKIRVVMDDTKKKVAREESLFKKNRKRGSGGFFSKGEEDD